jgi:hypothetical protein
MYFLFDNIASKKTSILHVYASSWAVAIYNYIDNKHDEVHIHRQSKYVTYEKYVLDKLVEIHCHFRINGAYPPGVKVYLNGVVFQGKHNDTLFDILNVK